MILVFRLSGGAPRLFGHRRSRSLVTIKVRHGRRQKARENHSDERRKRHLKLSTIGKNFVSFVQAFDLILTFFFCRDLMWQRKLPSPAPNPLFGDSQWKTCETMHKNYFSIDISHTNGIPDKECLRAINQKRFMQDYHFFDCFLSSKWRQIGV